MEKKINKKELGKGNPYQKVQGGSWYIFWYVTDPLTGKRKQCRKGGFRTKREAQTYLDKVKGEVATGTFRDANNQTFEQYATEWLINKKTLSPTTIEHYTFLLNKHIIPLIGNKKLKDLTARTFEQFYNFKEGEGTISNTTIKHLHRLIVNILNSAVRKDYILSNPATKVDNIPQKDEFHPELIDLDDIHTVINSAPTLTHKVAFALGFQMGLRRGEILGLTWDSINFKEQELSITKQLVLTTKGPIFKEPKTKGSIRINPIPYSVFKLLLELQEYQKSLKEKGIINEHNVVICKDNGCNYNPSSLTSSLKRTLKKLNLPEMRFHDTRHCCAQQLYLLGVDEKTVSDLLGHYTPVFTRNTYQHRNKNMIKNALNALDTSLNGQATQD